MLRLVGHYFCRAILLALLAFQVSPGLCQTISVSGNGDQTVWINQPVTIVFTANVLTSPTPGAECTLNGPTWVWPGTNNTSSTLTVNKTFTSVGDYPVSATAIASWTSSCTGNGPWSSSPASATVTIHVLGLRVKVDVDKTQIAVTKAVTGTATVMNTVTNTPDTSSKTITVTSDIPNTSPVSGTNSVSFSFTTPKTPTSVTVTGTAPGAVTGTGTAKSINPTGSIMTFKGWDSTENTVGTWQGQLTPTTVDFSGLAIIELDGGAGIASDTCHFPNSRYAEQKTIFHANWMIGANNVFAAPPHPDLIGWKPDAVTYYQANAHPLPCGFVHYQKLAMAWADQIDPGMVFTTNTQTSQIMATGTTSGDNGDVHSTTYP